jgi:hypothetical protein
MGRPPRKAAPLTGNVTAHPSELVSIADAGSTAGVWVGEAMLARGAGSGLAFAATVAGLSCASLIAWTALITGFTGTASLSGAAAVAGITGTALVSLLSGNSWIAWLSGLARLSGLSWGPGGSGRWSCRWIHLAAGNQQTQQAGTYY